MDSQQSMSQDLYLTLVGDTDTRLTSGVQVWPHALLTGQTEAESQDRPEHSRNFQLRPHKVTLEAWKFLYIQLYCKSSSFLFCLVFLLASPFMNLSVYLWFWLGGCVPITEIPCFSQVLCYCCDCHSHTLPVLSGIPRCLITLLERLWSNNIRKWRCRPGICLMWGNLWCQGAVRCTRRGEST